MRPGRGCGGGGNLYCSRNRPGRCDASPIYDVKVPPGYRDWKLIALDQGAPHGMCSTLKDLINVDLLAFAKS